VRGRGVRSTTIHLFHERSSLKAHIRGLTPPDGPGWELGSGRRQRLADEVGPWKRLLAATQPSEFSAYLRATLEASLEGAPGDAPLRAKGPRFLIQLPGLVLPGVCSPPNGHVPRTPRFGWFATRRRRARAALVAGGSRCTLLFLARRTRCGPVQNSGEGSDAKSIRR
jgi:hypothetical protein